MNQKQGKGNNACPVCGNYSTEFSCYGYDILYRSVRDIFSVFKCAFCKALFIVPFPSQDETKKYYPPNYYSYETDESTGFFGRLRDNIIKRHMEPAAKFSIFDLILIEIFKNKFAGLPLYRKEGANFLDVGCGNGNNLMSMEKYGWNTYGIELDEKAVRHARKQGLNVQCATLEGMDFPEVKFDAIRIWHVLEHLTDPQKSIEKISAFLKEDGEILMAVPNTASWARMLFGTYWYGLDVPRHVIDYSPETLDYIFKKNKLKIVKITYASCGSFLASVSNYFRHRFGYNGNLINNIFLLFLFSPIDYISDLFKRGDTIFLTVKKENA